MPTDERMGCHSLLCFSSEPKGEKSMPQQFAKPALHRACSGAGLKYCVYVLHSVADDFLYAGFSPDLKQRVTDHFNGNVAATAPRGPLHLIHAEYYLSRSDAVRREKYQTTKGKRALRLMFKDSLAQTQFRPLAGD